MHSVASPSNTRPSRPQRVARTRPQRSSQRQCKQQQQQRRQHRTHASFLRSSQSILTTSSRLTSSTPSTSSPATASATAKDESTNSSNNSDISSLFDRLSRAAKALLPPPPTQRAGYNHGARIPYTGRSKTAQELYTLYPTTPKRRVPAHIAAPPYVTSPKSNQQVKLSVPIEIKSAEDIIAMRETGAIAGYIRAFAGSLARAGITTDEIDAKTHDEIIRLGAYPSPLGYFGFTKSLGASVNHVVCHGVPDLRPLCDGDIVNFDITVYYNGFHGDCSGTFFVGDEAKFPAKTTLLVHETKRSMDESIALCAPGVPFSSIGHRVQEIADQHGFGTVPQYCGHGIGRLFHTAPTIIHAENNVPGVMQAGMVFTIEPILNMTRSNETITHNDKWTVINASGELSAQFEETIVVLDNGAKILTQCSPEQYALFQQPGITRGDIATIAAMNKL